MRICSFCLIGGYLRPAGQAAPASDHRPGRRLWEVLCGLKGIVDTIYIERVRVFSRVDAGFVRQNQSLLVNTGIWQGWMLAAGIPYLEVEPATWQAAMGIWNWRKQKLLSPLQLARTIWPDAALTAAADDGKAVALLLADLARRDTLARFNRTQAQDQAQAKAKAAKRNLRAFKTPQNDIPWQEL